MKHQSIIATKTVLSLFLAARPYKCSCGKEFVFQHHLYHHVYSGQVETCATTAQFKCDCGETFNNRQDLKDHATKSKDKKCRDTHVPKRIEDLRVSYVELVLHRGQVTLDSLRGLEGPTPEWAYAVRPTANEQPETEQSSAVLLSSPTKSLKLKRQRSPGHLELIEAGDQPVKVQRGQLATDVHTDTGSQPIQEQSAPLPNIPQVQVIPSTPTISSPSLAPPPQLRSPRTSQPTTAPAQLPWVEFLGSGRTTSSAADAEPTRPFRYLCECKKRFSNPKAFLAHAKTLKHVLDKNSPFTIDCKSSDQNCLNQSHFSEVKISENVF